ncbi:MAG TPA: hypothetical protein VG122_00095 [Gemmata sp.]|jgi:hypothetical protein|nr:hypothetical protein [Gemmata sp.]
MTLFDGRQGKLDSDKPEVMWLAKFLMLQSFFRACTEVGMRPQGRHMNRVKISQINIIIILFMIEVIISADGRDQRGRKNMTKHDEA